MEGEVDRSQLKHVCKLCNKRYPSGKSLGGHMRSHVIANAHKAKAFRKTKAPSFHPPTHHFHYDGDGDGDGDDQNGSGYGLRENPKKTWRASNHNHNTYQKQQGQQQQQEIRVCKQCGKAFQSVKALCGHMSSHSERERNFKYHDDDHDDDDDDDHSWSSDTDHSPDHTNNIISSSKRQTRSSYSRYTSPTLSNNNYSDIDQHQQEEVAICLMMLSRDHHHHSSNSSPHSKSFNFGPESSDNNSVIMEGGSSSNHVGGIIVGKTKDFNFMNTNKFKEVGMSPKVNVCQEMDNSDSGYFENGAKELESDDSVDGFFVRNYYYYSKNPGYDQFGSDGGSKKRVLSFESPESEANYSSKKINTNSQKVSKFECGKCHQTFKTYQALGGHIISSHRKNGTHENTLEEPNFAKKGVAKKAKGHKCPYCPKVFKSGQALGGHKRSHMMGGAHRGAGGPPPPEPVPEASPTPTPTPPPPPMIDLNLPAPLDEEEEASGNSEFVAW